MKKTIVTLFAAILMHLYAAATTYYVSSSGSDANPGTMAQPWLSISKVNAVAAANDIVLFERGGTWQGTLRPKANGITYDAYGSGPMPVITGFETLTTWTNVGSGKYSKYVPGVKSYCNILLINGNVQRIARTPNTTLWYNNGGTSSSVVYNLLSGQPSFVGGDVVAWKNGWRIDRGRITAQTSNTLSYVQQRGIASSAGNLDFVSQDAGYGFFVQNHEACLDAFGEWRVDSAASTVRLYMGAANPVDYNIQVSVVDTLVNIGSRTGITVRSLKFTGANVAAIHAITSSNVLVEGCSFYANTMATYFWNTSNLTITNNDYKHSLCQAIAVANRQRINVTVTNNTVDSTGLLAGQGAFAYTMQLKAISVEVDSTVAGHNTVISGNHVSNTGQAGIEFQGSKILVEKNYVYWYCRVLEDNGGIYTFTRNDGTPPQKRFRYRAVRFNIINHCPGADISIKNPEEPDVAGLYLDDQTEQLEAYGNTIAGINGPGIQLNNPYYLSIVDNTVYDCDESILVQAKNYSSLAGNVIKKNIFFNTTNQQTYFRYWDYNLQLPTAQTLAQSTGSFALVDSNYIYCTRSSWIRLWYSVNGSSTTFSNLAYNTWRSTYGQDANSSTAPVAVTGYSLVYNASDEPATAAFPGQRKIDMKGNVMDNSMSIAPYSSAILINNGTVPVPPAEPPAPGEPAPEGFIIVNWKLE
jgi:hypothetical protein